MAVVVFHKLYLRYKAKQIIIMADYPYIQDKKTLHNEICEVCSEVKESVQRLEWRVDWFQGNCEVETICNDCKVKREAEAKARKVEYAKKMAPVWKKQKEKQEKLEQEFKTKVNEVKELINKHGLSLKIHDNEQWTIGGKLDWWTTTGSAFNRKTKDRFRLSFYKLDELETKLLEIL